MNANKKRINTPGEEKDLNEYLQTLKLQSFYDNYSKVAEMAAKNQWSYPQYLLQLAESELLLRNQRSIERRIKAARFPVVKTLEGFDWTWPKKINRLQVQDLPFGICRTEIKYYLSGWCTTRKNASLQCTGIPGLS